jgi:hypothetical protein
MKSRLAAWLAARTEGWCLASVSGLFAVSERILADLVAQFPAVSQLPAGAAPYGFEPTDMALVRAGVAGRSGSADPATGSRPRDGIRRLFYIGSISDSQRIVLAALLDALVALKDADPVAAARLRIEMIGTTYAAPPRTAPRATVLIEERGLGDQVSEHPARVPYLEALTLTVSADANLVLGDLTTYYAASKLMPLVAARRPLLALLHADSEPATLLKRLGARGIICYGTPSVPSPSAAVPALISTLVDFVYDRIPIVESDIASDTALADRTAERMTGALAEVLDRVVDGPRAN